MQHIFKILRSTRELWRYYAAVSALSVVIALLTLVFPLLSGWAIDEIRKGTDARVGYMIALAFVMFIVDLAYTLVSNWGGYVGDQMAAKLTKLLSAHYYEHLLTLPQSFFDKELSGKIINRLNRSINQISSFMQMMSNNFLQFIFSTVFSLAVVAYYSWQVALMLGTLYPIFIWMTIRTSTKWQDYQKTKNKHMDIATGRFAESVGQIKVVKSFIQEKRELTFFNRHLEKVVKTNKPQSKYWHQRDIERRAILNVIFFVVFAYIFTQGARGVFTPGQAVALILYAMQIRIPIFTISFLVDITQKAIADSKDYFEIMEVKPEIADITGAPSLKVSDAQIVFDKVSFSYERSQPVIKKASLTIDSGSKIALVGESGEGKTTLTNLLMRLYEPEQGQILIDGQDVSKVTQSSLRRSIGVVFQDPSLFSGTVKENIGYANPSVSEDMIIAAAKAANAHDFIRKFDKGYETEIGEHGLKLSGGQKQRIAIARALLKDAPILILDEATSSLDSKSEAMVQEALERLMKNRTTIIIAHRLSTIEHVDKIVTLRNGSIDEVGSPGELAQSGGIYAQLLELQRGAKKSEKSKQRLRKFDIAA
jgi:ATP-binding cassette subfamily B protein